MPAMVDEAPLVSVVIPCFAQAHYLGEAIESVLAQTCPDVEIIVVDDGSPDDPAAVANKYPNVRLIRQVNQGVSAARNTGLHASSGEYLVFLDADDRLLPEGVSIGVGLLQSGPSCGFSYGQARLIDSVGTPMQEHPPEPSAGEGYLELLLRNKIWSPGQVMYRREAVLAANGFDEKFGSAADYDLNLRVAREYTICCDSRPVFEYRLYDTSMSQNAALMLADTMEVFRAQWPYVEGHPRYEEAFGIGRDSARAYYGDRLLNELSGHIRRGEWRMVLREAATVLRYYPAGLSARFKVKVLRSLSAIGSRTAGSGSE